MCIQKILNLFIKDEEPREESGLWLYTKLKTLFPEAEIFISDSDNYRLCNLDDINAFLKADLTDKIKYETNRMDCDDFASRLHGQFSTPPYSDLAVGKVWTDKHALNCLIDQNGEFWFIEPQTDELLSDLAEWQGNEIRFIEI